jgi:hypothetical protein
MKQMKKYFLLPILATILFCGNLFSQEEHREIENLIEKIATYHQDHRTSLIYRVQLCNTDEDKAYSTRDLFQKEFPEYKVFVIYEQPDWKTQFGTFLNRLEADIALLKVKKSFPEAIVTKERIK